MGTTRSVLESLGVVFVNGKALAPKSAAVNKCSECALFREWDQCGFSRLPTKAADACLDCLQSGRVGYEYMNIHQQE